MTALVKKVLIWGVILVAVRMAGGVAQPTAREYLSDHLNLLSFVQQGWGEFGIDTSAHAPGQKPLKLRIKDKEYAKGLGHHASGEIVVDLNGLYETFEAEIGVQWQWGNNVGSVVFQVFVDDVKKFDSGVMREFDSARAIRIPVESAQELRLVATDAGDGITCDCADWAEARLIRSASPKLLVAREEPLDLARFARVVTWDPNRMDGCRSNRVEEFREEDLFLESDVLPDAKGNYKVPTAAHTSRTTNGLGCIGLQWYERRRLREIAIQFADTALMPPPDGVQVQQWVGESPWQGNWVSLPGTIEPHGERWSFTLERHGNAWTWSGTEKVRWIFPSSSKPIVVRRLSAFTDSRWNTAELIFQAEKVMAHGEAEMEIYNGEFVGSSGPDSISRRNWNLSASLRLKVRSSKPRRWKSDRTIITLRLPSGSFGVAVEDVLTHGCVYVRDMGVFVSLASAQPNLTEYRKKVVRCKTVLQKVRKLPDQTFQQAMAKVHRAVQDNGPTMLSLACDNRKFVVQREGAVRFESFEMLPQFGSGRNQGLTRHLHGGWLPAPETIVEEDGVVYRQRTFVAPYDKTDTKTEGEPAWLNSYESHDHHPLCVTELIVDNPSAHSASVRLKLTFHADADRGLPAQLHQVGPKVIVQSLGRLLATVDAPEAFFFQTDIREGALTLKGAMPARTQARCFVYLPAWEMKPEESNSLTGGEELLSQVESYWKRVLSSAMQIRIPDPLLQNVILASQVHCLIAARNEAEGARIAPWIASMVYGPLESEANSIIRGMDLFGYHDFARRSLDYFIHRYNPTGFLTTGYTLMGTGWHLWTLGEHYQLTRDAEWMKRIAPEVARIGQWITKQCEKTKKLNAHGNRAPEYGLMPPGVVADWNRFAYRFFMQGHYYAGLRQAALALKEVGKPSADSLLRQSDEFREAILRAYRWTQARTPVVPLSNGAWAPGYPSMLYCFGPSGEMFPGEDGGRTWAGDVEIGAHHLIPLGILEANSSDASWIAEHMEDYWFLQSGMGEYPAEENERDWFNLGGFAKVQPYYGRLAEVYAARDEVKPFIRSYFNAIPSLLNTENLSFWEHFHNQGAWNKTHETGGFLTQTRFMFVMERGDTLWLAPFVTSNWLKDGLSVSVKNAPTRFGKVSYEIRSHVAQGYIEAVIDPPTRTPPRELVIRLRHPQGKLFSSALVNGVHPQDFDKARECIRLKPTTGTLTVRVNY